MDGIGRVESGTETENNAGAVVESDPIDSDNPNGFFFGVTENEFELAKKMGDQYLFCFVCLHPESLSYKYMNLSEVEEMTRTKRVQYQINFRN